MAQASHLVAFVKSLIENDNKTTLEQNKIKLKEEYVANGTSLNKNLAEKYEQVSEILAVYKYISERVKLNRSGVASIKNNLSQCKQLLHCNRTDLRRLWIELVEKRQCVKLLEALEEVKLAPELVTYLTESKMWFEATLVALKSQKKISQGLENVQAVLQIRADLTSRQKTLTDRLKSELHKMIFDDSLTSALKTFSTYEDHRGILTKKCDVKDSSLMNEIDQLLPSNFQHLRLSDWLTVSMTNDFRLERADMFDIKLASQKMNQIVPIDPNCNRPKQILEAIYSLYEIGKLQELLNEWSTSITNMHHPAAAAGSHSNDVSTIVEERLDYFRREIFKLIIIKSIEQIKRTAISQNDNRLENFTDCRYLLDLLEILYQALFQCQSALLLMHRAIRCLINSKKTDLSLVKYEDVQLNFDENSIRKIIQNELISILQSHLLMSKKDKANHSNQPNYELLPPPNSLLPSSQQTMNGSAQSATTNTINRTNMMNTELLKVYMGKKQRGILSSSLLTSNIQVISYGVGSQSIQIGGGGGGTDNIDSSDVANEITTSGNHQQINNQSSSNTQAAKQQQQQSLFKFANSSHAISVTACLQEMRPVTYNLDETDTTNIHSGISSSMGGSGSHLKHYPVVCKPHHNNITSIYDSIMEFVDAIEVEEQISRKTEFKNQCILRDYIKTFIENVFLKESLQEMNKKLNDPFKEPNSLKGLHNLVSQANERELGLQRPIISIVLVADQCLEEVKRITKSLKLYSETSLRNGYKVIEEFKNNLWKWYKDIGNSNGNQEIHMSMEWAKDPDLIRLWKTMPSWQNMIQTDARENMQSTASTPGCAAVATGFSTNSDNTMMGTLPVSFSLSEGLSNLSPGIANINFLGNQSGTSTGAGGYQATNKQFLIINESNDTSADTLLKSRQARLMVNKESRHDLQLIEDEAKSHTKSPKQKHRQQQQQQPQSPPQLHVFKKPEPLKQLARLHESVSWFTNRMSRFIHWIKSDQLKLLQQDSTANQQKVDNFKKLIHDFNHLYNDIQHLADACLMSIHLEGRLQAYNAIIRLPTDANYGIQLDEIDIDPQIKELIKSLSDMEFALTYSLTRHKFRFIFEGLGNFMSALFVQILSKIRKMTTSGVKKMCRNIYIIQQTLSILTQCHEMDLVRVKQLYELLHMSPEAIVDKIMEQGAVYEEEVYRNILQIHQQSNPLYSHDKLKAAMVRLGEVINMEFV